MAAAAEFVTIAILATFLMFFFLRDGDKAWVWAFQAASDEKRDLITTAGDDALARVGGYLRGTTVLSGLVAITDYVFMLVLGVPMAAAACRARLPVRLHPLLRRHHQHRPHPAGHPGSPG